MLRIKNSAALQHVQGTAHGYICSKNALGPFFRNVFRGKQRDGCKGSVLMSSSQGQGKPQCCIPFFGFYSCIGGEKYHHLGNWRS